MISQDIESIIREQVSALLELEAIEEHVYRISVPLKYADGDHFGFILFRDGESWKLTDDGDLSYHLGYSGVEITSKSRIDQIRQAANFFGVEEQDGALVVNVDNNNFASDLFRMIQCSFEVSHLARTPAIRKTRSRRDGIFRNEVRSFIQSIPELAIQSDWHDPDVDPHHVYSVDYTLTKDDKRILLFTPNTTSKALQASVASLRYRNIKADVDTLAVFDDESGISDKDKEVLADSVETVIPFSERENLRDAVEEKLRIRA